MKNKKVIIVTEYFPTKSFKTTGGIETRAYYVGIELAKYNDLTVITSWRKGLEKIDYIKNMKILRVGKIHKYSSKGAIFSRLRFAFYAYKEIVRRKCDVIFGYNFISYIPAFLAGKRVNVKKIATYHETWVGDWIKNTNILVGFLGEIWERIVLKFNWDKIIAVSQFTKNKLIDNGLDKKIIKVIPNGIDLDLYKFKKLSKFRWPSLCYAGRLTKNKRVGNIIKSIKYLKNYHPKIKFKIIGKGPEERNLKRLVRNLNLEENVIFYGHISNHINFLRTMGSCHIFISASILEGFGITLIEACALGLPYVISNIQPYKEITKKGEGGLFFKTGHPKQIAQKIRILTKSDTFYRTKKSEAKKLSEIYNWDHIISNHLKDYI